MKNKCPLSAYDLREIEREYRIYLDQHRHIPGRKCDRETFILAAARSKLRKNQINRAGITNDALMNHLKKRLPDLNFERSRWPDPCSDLLKAFKFARTKSAKAVAQLKSREFSRWIGGPFGRAVSLVLAGLEGKPAPTRHELMRRFRVPGSKNCTAEELTKFRGMIDRMAAEIFEWRPNLNDPNLDPAQNDLIPTPTDSNEADDIPNNR